MTVRYADEFAKNSSLGAFAKLLAKWKGSVYRFVWKEYLVFITLFFSISFVYRFALDDDGKRYFEKLANFCERAKEVFRLYFVLGFFVTSIVSNWWKMYDLIPYADPVAHFVYTTFHGNDKETREFRKNIVRQSCLSVVLTFMTISPALKKIDMDQLIQMKLLFEDEKVKLEKVKEKNNNKYHVLPIVWAIDLVMKAKDGKNIDCSKIFDQLDKLRSGCCLLLEYEHYSMPLAYTQVVAISVYFYFISCLLGSQWLERNDKFMDLDLYFPILTTVEFIIYMGWLKVAASLIMPFGGDHDDFDLEQMVLNNHLETCYEIEDDDAEDANNENDDKPAVTHNSNNETVINCSSVDPERIPLSSLSETDYD